MHAEAIFTGTEMLLGQITNTNAAFLGEQLAATGISLYCQVVVGDNLERIKQAINNARKEADIIIVSGGLGPTEDDLSREALAEALNLRLVEHPEALENVKRYFKSRDLLMTSNNLKQALVPEGAKILNNPVGTACGIFLEHDNKRYILLPGPPHEFKLMVTEQVLPLLQLHNNKKEIILSRILKMTNIGESAVEKTVKDLLHGQNPTVAPLSKPGQVILRITARANSPEKAKEMITPLEKEIRQRLKDFIFGTDDDTLEGIVGKLLAEKNLTLATAESCTGGLVANRITNISGSSSYFLGGMITYSNEAKINLLGVDPYILKAKGAVSPDVAEAMATGIRNVMGADIGIGITGIAGPGGGSPQKPVGLVYIGLDYKGKLFVKKNLFAGQREIIKWQSSQNALYLLWKNLNKS